MKRDNPEPGQSKRRAVHWRELGPLKKRYSAEVYYAYMEQAWTGAGRPKTMGTPWPKAALKLTWRSVRLPPDRDNALGSCKTLIDALRCQQPTDGEGRYWLGLVENDDAECLVSVAVDIEKLRPELRDLEGILVELTRAD